MSRDDIRASYDTVADEYTRRFLDELDHKPLDRALLDGFAELVRGTGPVLDVGCGPGHAARYLRERGLDAGGLDLSPAMIERARAHHPGIPFEVGDLLELGDRQLAGIAALYAICNLPPDDLLAAARSFHRALAAGGRLLVSFHASHDGAPQLHMDEWWGMPVSVDFWFHPTDTVAFSLEAAGFTIDARFERRPYPEIEYPSQRAYLFARRS